MTPYYEEEGIVIYHGDCRDILPQLPKVDLVLTDPPYGASWNTNYSRFSHGKNDKPAVVNDAMRFELSWIRQSATELIVWGANYHAIPDPGGFLIWDKRCRDGFSFLSDAETAWWNGGTGCYIYNENAQRHRSTEGGLHPTQKPVGLMEWCIRKAKATHCIIDPFCGSGSTLVAAKNLGRKAIGIEIEERYCEIAVRRLAQAVLPLGSGEGAWG